MALCPARPDKRLALRVNLASQANGYTHLEPCAPPSTVTPRRRRTSMSEIPLTPEEEMESGLSRKQFVAAVGLGAIAAPVVAGAMAGPASALQGQALPLACTPGGSTTIAQTEGPY